MNSNGNLEEYKVEINGKTYEIAFSSDSGKAVINGEEIEFDVQLESPPDQFSFLLNNKSYIVAVEPTAEQDQYRMHAGGYEYQTEVISKRDAYLRDFINASGAGKKAGIVKAPMPGKIVKISCEEGSPIDKNQGVLIMEAMKMENEIKSPFDGVIKKIHVAEGDAVDKGQVLFELE